MTLRPAALLALLALSPLSLTGTGARAEPPAEYVGQERCVGCHTDVEEAWSRTVHAKALREGALRGTHAVAGCEGCHGPGGAHSEAKGKPAAGDLLRFDAATPEARRLETEACLACHTRGDLVHWPGGAHESSDLSCTSCHALMKQVSPRGMLATGREVELCGSCHLIERSKTFRNAHMPLREGKQVCTGCHAPHGSLSQAMLARESVNDTCYTCHAEKRGPFLYEHPPVTESCTSCHDAHGAVRAGMLIDSVPRLCQSCHLETLHPGEARLPANRFVIGSGCMQCHMTIHGSNHPSGFGLIR